MKGSGKLTYLASENALLLRQALVVLDHIDASTYGSASHRIGAHLRHILEFDLCALDGIESHQVDYDRRQRNREIETSPQVARAVIHRILSRLDLLQETGDDVLWVAVEDAGDELPDEFMLSSISRELQFLRSHTIHHFALMVPALRAAGVPLSPQFGVAPSTLRYLASNAGQQQTQMEVQLCAR